MRIKDKPTIIIRQQVLNAMTVEQPIETRLLNYIAENGLHSSQLLPNESELAKLLECNEEELIKTLHDMEKSGLVQKNRFGWNSANPERHDAKDIFSLSKAALKEGHPLETKVIEKAIRLPLVSKEDVVWTAMEKRAQASLGLKPDEPFIVIVRLRKLTDPASEAPQFAISRVYLNPARFPADFLDKDQDKDKDKTEEDYFSKVSLTHLYRQQGYELTRRDTVLQARTPYLFERNELKMNGYDISPVQPVLHAEQELFAKTGDKEEFHLEFLQATYVNWVYTIKNRPM